MGATRRGAEELQLATLCLVRCARATPAAPPAPPACGGSRPTARARRDKLAILEDRLREYRLLSAYDSQSKVRAAGGRPEPRTPPIPPPPAAPAPPPGARPTAWPPPAARRPADLHALPAGRLAAGAHRGVQGGHAAALQRTRGSARPRLGPGSSSRARPPPAPAPPAPQPLSARRPPSRPAAPLPARRRPWCRRCCPSARWRAQRTPPRRPLQTWCTGGPGAALRHRQLGRAATNPIGGAGARASAAQRQPCAGPGRRPPRARAQALLC
jgi:hypothetical protein